MFLRAPELKVGGCAEGTAQGRFTKSVVASFEIAIEFTHFLAPRCPEISLKNITPTYFFDTKLLACAQRELVFNS
jgi:hypothetical protein